MTYRIVLSLVVCSALVSSAAAQTVRFETTEGNFDMVLNPNKLAVLQGHVDNMLKYIEDNRYLGSWINRADTGFVLQMGGFFSHTKRPGVSQDFLHGVQQYDEILQGEPAAETGLSNTTGTVAMALSGGAGGTNQDSGTSSFFVNVADTNTFLDADFTVFAAIPDMTTINKIMALTTQDIATQLGADAGNLAFAKVPTTADGKQVFIKRAYVITDTLATAQAMAGIQSVLQNSAAAAAANGLAGDISPLASSSMPAAGSGSASAASSGLTVVPEPASATLAVFAVLSFFGLRRSR